MRTKLFILIAFIFLFSTYMKAQTNASLEAGFSVGLASFQTDYGERGDFKSGVTGNVGLALGGVVYVNFFNLDPAINGPLQWGHKHLKLKIEGSYLQANLEHFGSYAQEDTEDGAKLRNMTGKSRIINFGTILEYHPFPIPDYVTIKDKKTTPYFGIGIMTGYSMPIVETAGGDWETDPIPNLILAYQKEDAVDDSNRLALSLMLSGGLRFKLDDNSFLQVDMRWQYFASNYIDGLNPDTSIVPNNHNDWLYYLNFGYIYKFGSETKISTWFQRRKR